MIRKNSKYFEKLADEALSSSIGIANLDYILDGNLEKAEFSSPKAAGPLTYITTPERLLSAGVDYKSTIEKYPAEFYTALERKNNSIKGFLVYDPKEGSFLYDSGTGLAQLIKTCAPANRYNVYSPPPMPYLKMRYDSLCELMRIFKKVEGACPVK